MNLSLNERLVSIGIRITGKARFRRKTKKFVDIESTLIDAMMAHSGDARMISFVLSWINIHGKYIIIEKLMKLRTNHNVYLISMMAAYAYEIGLHKWKTLIKKSSKTKFLYPKTITKSAVKLKGAIPWLKKINVIVPQDSLRIRDTDILSPSELIKTNLQYRNRYLYGASWRADIITAIEFGCKSPTEIVRFIGCSYEPAHRIFKEYSLAVG